MWVEQRFRQGGTAWFPHSPHEHKWSYDLDHGFEWDQLEPYSLAMREVLEWLVLYLCLGWEIPAWGPVPGVRIPSEE